MVADGWVQLLCLGTGRQAGAAYLTLLTWDHAEALCGSSLESANSGPYRQSVCLHNRYSRPIEISSLMLGDASNKWPKWLQRLL